MKRRLEAELWDKMHYLFRDFNDRMVHVELKYDFAPDIEALKTVIICDLEKVPVLHSKFVDMKLWTHWEVMPYNMIPGGFQGAKMIDPTEKINING